MKVLNELYDTISQKMAYEEKKWEGFKLSLNSSLKKQFFQLLQQGYSDKEIAYELFRSEKAIAPYRNTKSDVKAALQLEVLKFNASNYRYSRFQRAYYNAIKQQAVLKILVGLGKNSSIKDLGENLIKRASYFEITDIVVDVSRQLYLFYSVKEPDAEREEHYSTLNDKYFKILEEELKAEKILSKIASKFATKSVSHQELIKIAENYLEDNPIPKTPMPSYHFYHKHYLISIYLHELKNAFSKAEKVALEAYNFFCSKHYDHKFAKQQFLLHVIYSQLQLGRIKDSINYQELAIELARDGEPNWFLALELKTLSLLSCQNYKEARHTHAAIIDNHFFIHQPLNKRIRWTLMGLYVQFLRRIDLIKNENPSTQSINHDFKFLDENKSELKDLEIPYIIAQLLFNICDREYDAIESKIYSLKNYCNTYLKKGSPNFRSNCFIKMLLQVPLNNFHPRAVERIAMPYQRKLEAEAFKIDHERVVEIIPYEKLWAIILNHLEVPRRQRTSEYSVSDWSLGKRGLA